MRPLRVQGRTVHTIGLPYHWSYVGRVTGDPANELFPFVADPNVSIQESKASTADLRPGRRSFGRRSATGIVVPPPLTSGPPRDMPGVISPHRFPSQEPRRQP
jgi:formate dehydrogenase major subunit